jgi:hypothetical protein
MRAKESPADSLKRAQRDTLQPDRDPGDKELGLVRSCRGQAQGVAPPLGIEVAGTVQRKRALDERFEAQCWAELDDHLDGVFAARSDSMRHACSAGDRLSAAKHTFDPAADRPN